MSAVDANGFELAVGWEMANKTWRWNQDGSQTLIREDPYDNSHPKRISTAGTRLGNDPSSRTAGEETYYVLEIQVGDRVWVHTTVSPEGEERATQLCIMRRPGGKIPPLPPDQWGGPAYMSTLYQAEQDWEEKGIPIPAKYLDKDGRYKGTNPPYPPEAPAPRPAAAKP